MIRVEPASGTVRKDQRLWISIDWSHVPAGETEGAVTITGPDARPVSVKLKALNPSEPTRSSLHGFVETNGCVSIEAEHYTRKVDAGDIRWEKIDDLGRTNSSMALFPVTAPSRTPPENSPVLEYEMYLFHLGKIEVETIMAPTINFVPGRGLRFALSFDDQPPQIIDALAHPSTADWSQAVEDSVRKVRSTHEISGAGYHTLKLWMVDPGVVVQKLVVNTGGVKPSYLGPPESYHASP